MPTLFQQIIDGSQYRVVSAGNSIRLYRDGIFHSQFNPSRCFDGSVWDLLWLPLLFRSWQVPRIAVLGVGGGAILRRLLTLYPQAELVGIDLDATHLRIARRYFKVPKNVELIQQDAESWLKRYQGKPFDAIIDDVFDDGVNKKGNAHPVRAITYAAERCAWLNMLCKRLQRNGLLIGNCASTSEARKAMTSALSHPRDPRPGRYFCHSASFRSVGIDNAVMVLSREALKREHWAAELSCLKQSSKIIAPVRMRCHKSKT